MRGSTVVAVASVMALCVGAALVGQELVFNGGGAAPAGFVAEGDQFDQAAAEVMALFTCKAATGLAGMGAAMVMARIAERLSVRDDAAKRLWDTLVGDGDELAKVDAMNAWMEANKADPLVNGALKCQELLESMYADIQAAGCGAPGAL
jgi:NADH:ubiquinone oxidoreductase subunit K